MAQEDGGRRLAAILSADMVGYSRLMEADEAGTIARQKAHRAELIDPTFADHRGRIVKTTGDGLLVEFASAVDAVLSAVAVQRAMADREAGAPEARRIRYRVGINVGDIVIDGDDILGDGVNLAARLHEIAEPGGITISGNVHEQVRAKLDFDFRDGGERQVKNITQPIHVWHVSTGAPPAAGATGAIRQPTPALGSGRAMLLAIAAIVLLSLAGWVVFWLEPWRPAFNPALALPDKPSIAVLPFTNLSDDPSQEYFVDGMTEDLITDLSKVSGLFVVARNSVFTYKGKAVKVRQVAEELGVRYVLEGSVRRAGDRVRINAQLIDATTGGHLWADRYDGGLRDVFALQDKKTAKIVAALAVQLTAEETAAKSAGETDSAEAHDAFLQGWSHFRRRTPDDYAKALPWFDKAVAIDPNYGRAWAALASLFLETQQRAWMKSLGLSGSTVARRLEQSLEEALNRPTALAHQVKAEILAVRAEQFDGAVAEVERAIALEPNDPDTYALLSYLVGVLGQIDKAIRLIEKAMRLDPYYPAIYLRVLAVHHFHTQAYVRSIELLERARARNPEDWFHLPWLAAAYAHAGRLDEARAAAAELRQSWPGREYGAFAAVPVSWKFSMPRISPVSSDLADGLLKAGVPEVPEGISVRQKDRVPGEALRDLLFGATAAGNCCGGTWMLKRQPDGTAQHFWDGQPTYKSKTRIYDEDDALCISVSSIFSSSYCCNIYQNNLGGKDTLDEYISVCSHGVYPFARFELSSE